MGESIWRFLSITLLFGSSLAHAGPCPRPISPQDTPAFDALVQKFGGRIPFPPEDLVESVLRDQIQVVASVIPHGRSLERAITTYEKPRSLFSFALKKNQNLFLAYTPVNQQLQVISQNPGTGGFDFFLVDNYGPGTKPTVRQPPAGTCFACHQNRGPIFSAAPWEETEFGDNGQKMLSQRDLEPFARYLLRTSARDELRPIVNPQSFEDHVAQVSTRLAPRPFCGDLCKQGGLACKEALVRGALMAAFDPEWKGYPKDDRTHPELLVDFGDLQALRRDGMLLSPDFLISDRTDFLLSSRRSIGKEHVIAPGVKNDPLIPRPGHAVERKPAPSPLVLADYVNAQGAEQGEYLKVEYRGLLGMGTACMNFSAPQKRALSSFGSSEIRAALKTPGLRSMVEKFPPHPGELTDAISNAVAAAHGTPAGPGCFSPRRVRPGPSEKSATPAALFTRYCAACHWGPHSVAPALPLYNPDALATYVGTAGRTVKSVLSGPKFLMPPLDAPEPTPTEREELLRAIRALPR